ncbi:hypothetical protein NCS52_01562400 [Fusarium sp. LHS14.1]|nr:hypothetical protein NCS52_01562400 [Fusarium sp. LHS14.1]
MMAQPCFVCAQMQSRRLQKHGSMRPADSKEICVLCNRGFCDKNGGKEAGVCEINHQTYYQRHSGLPNVYPNLSARAAALEQENRENADD